MLKTLFLTLVAAALCGCVAPPARQRVIVAAPVARPLPMAAPAQAAPVVADADPDEVDLVPPVPTFTSVADCEQAYGAGQCGTGTAVYESAHLEAPPDANVWFVPFAYGVMTGVLVNRYFAPPSVYVSTVEYRRYVAPVVIERYRVVDRRTIEVYHRAPVGVRTEAFRGGPARYSPARGVITHASIPAHAYNPSAAQRPSVPARAQPHTPAQTSTASASPRPPVSMPTPRPAVQPVAARTETSTADAHQRSHPAAAVTPAPTPAARPSAAPPAEHKAKPCNPSLPKSASNCSA